MHEHVGPTNGVGKLLVKCPTCPYKGSGTYFFFTNYSFADSFVKEYAFCALRNINMSSHFTSSDLTNYQKSGAKLLKKSHICK